MWPVNIYYNVFVPLSLKNIMEVKTRNCKWMLLGFLGFFFKKHYGVLVVYHFIMSGFYRGLCQALSKGMQQHHVNE